MAGGASRAEAGEMMLIEDPLNKIYGVRLPQLGQLHVGDLFPVRYSQHENLSHLKP